MLWQIHQKQKGQVGKWFAVMDEKVVKIVVLRIFIEYVQRIWQFVESPGSVSFMIFDFRKRLCYAGNWNARGRNCDSKLNLYGRKLCLGMSRRHEQERMLRMSTLGIAIKLERKRKVTSQ